MESWPKKIDDVLADITVNGQNEKCAWEPLVETDWKEGWRTIKEMSCRVVEWPPLPWDKSVKGKKAKWAWKEEHPDQWDAYVDAKNAARDEAIYYAPYEKDKCDEVGGRKVKSRRVPFKSGQVKEIKDCPRSWEEEPEEEEPEEPEAEEPEEEEPEEEEPEEPEAEEPEAEEPDTEDPGLEE